MGRTSGASGAVGAYRNAVLERKNSAAVVAPDAPVLHCMEHRVQVVNKNVAKVVVGVALSQKMHIYGGVRETKPLPEIKIEDTPASVAHAWSLGMAP